MEDVATTDKSLLDFGSQVHKYTTDRQLLTEKSSEEETQDKLKGEEGAEGSEEALAELSDELSQKDGLTETAEVNLYDGSELEDATLVGDENDFNKTQAKAGYHEANQDIYINIDQTDMTDSSQTVRALVHEQERHTNAQNGSDYSEQSQTDLARARGERAESVWNDYSDLHGIETKSTTSQKNWNQKNRKSQEVQTGTKKLAQVESEEVKPLITPDTIWDIANIAYDLGKAGYALTKGDEALLEEALTDLAADTVAALIPGLPAGTSKLAKIAAKKLKDGKKLTKKESEALSQAVEAKKAQRQGEAQTPSTRGTSKSGGNSNRGTSQDNMPNIKPDGDIQVGGKTYKPSNLAEDKGNAKVYRGLSRQEQDRFVDDLIKDVKNPPLIREGGRVKIYSKPDGTKITVRDKSKSNDGNWNIDVQPPQKPGQPKPKKDEYKFK